MEARRTFKNASEEEKNFRGRASIVIKALKINSKVTEILSSITEIVSEM